MAAGVLQKPIVYQLKLGNGLLRDFPNNFKKNKSNTKKRLENVNGKKGLDYTNYIE